MFPQSLRLWYAGGVQKLTRWPYWPVWFVLAFWYGPFLAGVSISLVTITLFGG